MSTKKLQVVDYTVKQAENADTVDGKHASEFASAADVSDLQTKIGDAVVSEQISNAINAIDYPVDSVNGKTGEVALAYEDLTSVPFQPLSSIGTASGPTSNGLYSISIDIAQFFGQYAHYNYYSDYLYVALQVKYNGTTITMTQNAGEQSFDMKVLCKGNVVTLSCLDILRQYTLNDDGSISRTYYKFAKDTDVLQKTNTTEYTPTSDYHPATKKYVDNKVAGLVDSAPETLDTLNELSAALGDDPNFATTVATQIGSKVDKVDGKGLSTNDYTTDEKNKLAGIEAGATANSASSTTPKVAGTAAVGTETAYARGDHVHPAQTTVSGNAGTATKLETARTIRTDLASTSTSSFDGSADITPGVTGTLPIANGGTGATAAAAARANLGFTYGTSAPTDAPSTGAGAVCFVEDDGTPLAISEGGTGATAAADAITNLGFGGKILWSGGWYMKYDHTATLSENVSVQPNGIVIVFSQYYNGTILDSDFFSFFIPKKMVELFPGNSHTFLLGTANFGRMSTKTLLVYDDKVVGTEYNINEGTYSGISFDNHAFVMRYVIGV